MVCIKNECNKPGRLHASDKTGKIYTLGYCRSCYTEFLDDPAKLLEVIKSLSFELHQHKTKANRWVVAPNHIFFNLSPFDMIMAGKGKVVIEKLLEWLDR